VICHPEPSAALACDLVLIHTRRIDELRSGNVMGSAKSQIAHGIRVVTVLILE